jgi:arylamine N-acetyltransferase
MTQCPRSVTAHEQTIICSKTALQRNAHEQTIICRQLFAVPSANQNDGKNNMNDKYISLLHINGRYQCDKAVNKNHISKVIRYHFTVNWPIKSPERKYF